MPTRNPPHARKYDARNEAVFSIRLDAEHWSLIDALRASLAGPTGEPTDAAVVRLAIRELAAIRCPKEGTK